MAVINKTGITNGATIEAEHITRAIDALSGVSTDTIIASGSFTGSFTGTVTGTGSYATQALTSSLATTAAGVNITNTTTGTGPYYPVFSATTGDGAIMRTDTSTFTYNATTNTLTVTSSFATTASYALNGGGGVTINSNTDNYLVTATGTTNTLNGESRMTFDGYAFTVGSGARTVDFKDLSGGAGLVLPLIQPSSPVIGSTWFSADSGTLYIYGSSGWVGVTLS